MGMVRRRTRRRTMLVAGGAAYAAGRAGRNQGDKGYEDEPQEEVPPAPPPSAQPTAESGADELQRLADLHDSGALNDDEFAAAKAKALGI